MKTGVIGRHVFLAGLLSVLSGFAAAQSLTNIWWTGAAGDGLWSSPGNWSEGILPDTNHVVLLGYEGTAKDVPDEPQTISLDTDTSIWMLNFYAQGNRAVSLDSDGSHRIEMVRTDGSVNNAAMRVNSTVGHDISIRNVEFYFSGMGDYFFHQYSTNVFTFEPGCSITRSAGQKFQCGNASGPWRFRSSLGLDWRLRSRNTIYLDGGDLAGMNATSGADFILEKDAVLGSVAILSYNDNNIGQAGTLRRQGAGDRTVTVDFTVSTSGGRPTWDHSSDYVEVVEREGDEGHLTVRVQYWRVLTTHLLTDADTTVEIYPGSTRRMEYGTVPLVQGPGRVVMNMDSPAKVFTVQGSFGQTGDMLLNTGILDMASYTLPTNDLIYISGLVSDGTYYGGLSPYSPLYIGSDATLRLHAEQPQTVAGLSGSGKVQLRGSSLTVNGDLSPGSSTGTLTVEDAGDLILDGGTHLFEFTSDTNQFDRVVFTDMANVTLDGELQITAPQDFYEYGAGRYTIFALNGGDINGTFSNIIAPVAMEAEVETDNGDVVLVLKSMTGSMVILR